MEPFLLNKLTPEFINEVHEVLKKFIETDNYKRQVLSYKTHRIEISDYNYHIDCGNYDNTFFIVIMSLEHEYIFSIGNSLSPDINMEFYEDNSVPFYEIPFPDEFTEDAVFNLSTIHNTYGISVNFMKDAFYLYTTLRNTLG